MSQPFNMFTIQHSIAALGGICTKYAHSVAYLLEAGTSPRTLINLR